MQVTPCLRLWPPVWRRDRVPTGHESLSILLYCTRKTSHRGRTTPPSCIKWWFYVFRKWVRPLANKWSAMVAFILYPFKTLFSSVWKTKRRTTCSRRLTRSFSFKTPQLSPELTSLYIKWHIYRRFRWRVDFLRHYQTGRKAATVT